MKQNSSGNYRPDSVSERRKLSQQMFRPRLAVNRNPQCLVRLLWPASLSLHVVNYLSKNDQQGRGRPIRSYEDSCSRGGSVTLGMMTTQGQDRKKRRSGSWLPGKACPQLCVRTSGLQDRLSLSWPSRGSPPRPGGPSPPGCCRGSSLPPQEEMQKPPSTHGQDALWKKV
uniref:uncharacterized protein LOC120824826 isoform X3 n=1 Tax=Gasterosteus aculeatus aculeatus TaxID=481459 RepID=UPI001A991495|nr:uncharacterized protein LOC120824826 isoform X3 [Gasterosteus aculeatus aculeatus]